MRKNVWLLLTLTVLLDGAAIPAAGGEGDLATKKEFQSRWDKTVDRVWIGPDWRANRVEDWRIAGGRLECVRPGLRTAFLLSRTLGDLREGFRLSVRTGLLGKSDNLNDRTFTGFLVSNRGKNHYKATVTVGDQDALDVLLIGLSGEGKLLIHIMRDADILGQRRIARHESEDIRLEFEVAPWRGNSQDPPSENVYTLTLSAFDHKTGKLLDCISERDQVPPDRLEGHVALVSSSPPADATEKPDAAGAMYWFRDFATAGKRVELHNERCYGPVVAVHHTSTPSLRTVDLTARFLPIGEKDTPTARLEIRRKGAKDWQAVATEKIRVPYYYAPFHVDNFDNSQPVDYRIVYTLRGTDGEETECVWSGRIP